MFESLVWNVSSDAVVLLILLNYSDDINSCTIFKTSHHEYYFREIVWNPISLKHFLVFMHFQDVNKQVMLFQIIVLTDTLSSPNVSDAFDRLGNDKSPSEADLTKFEKFVLSLYCKNTVPSSVTMLADLRWQMLSYSLSQKNSILIGFHPLLLHWRKMFPGHMANLPTLSRHHCQVQMIMVSCLTKNITC